MKGVGGGGGDYIPIATLSPTRMTYIKMGSDESHFNVSLIVMDKVTRQCPQTTTCEEKGEPKRIRTEVPPLTRSWYCVIAFYIALFSALEQTRCARM